MGEHAKALQVWRACGSGEVGRVRHGLESGVPLHWQNPDEMERTFLHHAAEKGCVGVVELLLEQRRIRINARDEDDRTPLHRAVKSASRDCVVKLLAAGARVQEVDFAGNSALHIAARKNLLNVAVALLDAGALKDVENKAGQTPYEMCTDVAVRDCILKHSETPDEDEMLDNGEPRRRTCWRCGREAANRCTACRVANYCSAECQRTHWTVHRVECARLKRSNAEAVRVFNLSSLDEYDREIVAAANLPHELVAEPLNLFPLLNALHFITGRVYSTRHPTLGRKLITAASSASEEDALAFFAAEEEAALVLDGDPRMELTVEPESRRRNVFRGQLRGVEGFVAVKIMPFQNARKKRQLLREVGIVAANKTNSVPQLMGYHGCWKSGNKLWLASEWIDGGTLQQAAAIHDFKEDEITFVMREVLLGLAVLHRRQIVHRDIKPQNVMLDRSGGVRIIDFGLCATVMNLQVDQGRGGLSRMVGSPLYVPPEMVMRLPYDWAADVWSLGLTLLFLIRKGVSFHNGNPLRCMFMHAVQPIEPHDMGEPKTELKAFVWQMLQRNPFLRPSPQQMLDDDSFWNSTKLGSLLANIWPGDQNDAAILIPETEDDEIGKEDQDVTVSTGLLLDNDAPVFDNSALPLMDMNEMD